MVSYRATVLRRAYRADVFLTVSRIQAQTLYDSEDILITCRQCQRPRSNPCDACARLCSRRAPPPHTHTLTPVSVSAPCSKAKHVIVRQRLTPEARFQVASSCRPLQGRTGACRAPLRAVSRSVGASSLRRDDAEGCCTRDREKAREEERERERWFGLTTLHATKKEGGRERVAWHLVTVSRLETKPTFSLLRRMVEVMPRFNTWCA